MGNRLVGDGWNREPREEAMWTVPEGGDIGSSQAGGCGFGEKWPDSGSTVKVELSGVPYKLDMRVDLRKKVFLFLFCFKFVSPIPTPSKCRTGPLGEEQVGWGTC